jgi:hypothetical protein
MNELQYLKYMKTDIEAKIAEIESNQAKVKDAEWMRKFSRLLCWFEENAPDHETRHEIDIIFDELFCKRHISANREVIDDLRTKIRDGVVEL